MLLGESASAQCDGSPDLWLVIRDRKFLVHRNLLALHSLYFRSMFESFREKDQEEVEIKEVADPKHMEQVRKKVKVEREREIMTALSLQIFRFIYAGNINLTPKNVQTVLELASFLQMVDLQSICTNYMKVYTFCATKTVMTQQFFLTEKNRRQELRLPLLVHFPARSDGLAEGLRAIHAKELRPNRRQKHRRGPPLFRAAGHHPEIFAHWSQRGKRGKVHLSVGVIRPQREDATSRRSLKARQHSINDAVRGKV